MYNLENLIDSLYKNLPIEEIYKNPLFIVDFLIIIFIFYAIYKIFKNTRGERIFYGFIILGVIYFLSYFFDLYMVNTITGLTFIALIIAIPVVFQPELRSALERLGRTGIKKIGEKSLDENNEKKIIIDSIRFLSKNKIGAIIVITKKTGVKEYITSGIKIDGILSKDLLISCFIKEGPLHDGAVIITKNKIIAASTILPLSDSDQVLAMGTRHRAGLGLSEVSDSLVIIISEKNGEISFAKSGKFFSNIMLEKLKKFI